MWGDPEATVITTSPVIDGRLDDAAWRAATVFSGFTQREPQEGAPTSERTEVRLLTDGEALYIGAWMFDRDPARIVAEASRLLRDPAEYARRSALRNPYGDGAAAGRIRAILEREPL